MSKNCGWCASPSLQAKCIYCGGGIYICHNSVDCSWSHRNGGFDCITCKGHSAHPLNGTIEPSSTDDIPKPVDIKQYPAVILATTLRSGKTYATMIGIENYRIVMSMYELEGIKTRGVVITPGYYDKVEKAKYKAAELVSMANLIGRYTNAPQG